MGKIPFVPIFLRRKNIYQEGKMRKTLNFNQGWNFYKGVADVSAERTGGESVDLPHSWNATDGQDGGNDYFRGSCLYVKTISKAELPENEE